MNIEQARAALECARNECDEASLMVADEWERLKNGGDPEEQDQDFDAAIALSNEAHENWQKAYYIYTDCMAE